jgi:hypothetical protein
MMHPMDSLTLAAQAAQVLHLWGDSEAGLAVGYRFLRKRPAKDEAEPLPVRIARLVCAAGERKAELLQFLWGQVGKVPKVDRTQDAPEEPLLPPDPEAERLYKVVQSRRVKRRKLMPDGLHDFNIALRRAGGRFGGRFVTNKQGWTRFKPEGLPQTVRGLIAYPLEVPVLFPIEVGPEPWSVWDICCAFADQYMRIYEHADRYGVWGHGLTDLWIEGLTYYPQHQLIDAAIGS